MQTFEPLYRPDSMQKRVWVDTDITIGERNGLSVCDVDDGYALGVLMRSQEVDLVGVSSTRGNTDDIHVSTRVARTFIEKFGPTSLRVSCGSAQAYTDSLNQPLPEAVTALAEQLKQEPLTIVAIGALTNIALLVHHYPELVSAIEEVVCIAGRRDSKLHFVAGRWQPRPFRDLNFEFDEPAFNVLLNSEVKLTLVPFEVCRDVWVDFHELRELGKGSSLSEFLEQHSRAWYLEWKAVFGAKEGFIPFDMLAAAYVVNPQWFTLKQWHVQVQRDKSDTKPQEEKNYLVCNEGLSKGKMVNYAVEISPAAAPELFKRLTDKEISAFVLGLSHVNIIVDDVDSAADYYQRVLGFDRAMDAQGNKMDYRSVQMAQFNRDAGLGDQDVCVDVLFLKHPYAGIYLELMKYHTPQGRCTLPEQPKTYDLGGPRHIALEVSNCTQVFNYLKKQEGVSMISPADNYHPEKLDGFPISFFYWIDRYGVQWEMEEGRRVGTSRGIV
ncbi:nucleoside hydrolase [Vibrio cidicii]|uniref:nucleoside hydrolase n=1 Tax=Vibrio cidicii TaxID=1763883 RepID=UPI0018C32A6A|nr:nucleoside hydrolase [Vibrio cidicii]MBG0756317.1 nucleoside hydrolase [Vibrio cidicii]